MRAATADLDAIAELLDIAGLAEDAMVAEGAEFPENSYILGTPGRRIRETTPEERRQTLEMLAQSLRSDTRG